MSNELSLPYNIRKLNKALYVLKQASWAWFQKFTIVNTSFGFFYSDNDSIVFGQTSFHGIILLSFHVDDNIIIGDDDLKLQLVKQFEMKDLGIILYFLGIVVVYSPKG